MSVLAAVFIAGSGPVLDSDMFGPNPALNPDVATGPIFVTDLDTHTVAITFWAGESGTDGYFDLTDAAVSAKFAYPYAVDSVYVDTDRSMVKYANVKASYGSVCAYDNNYNGVVNARSDGNLGTGSRAQHIVWFDFQSIIPSGAVILDARVPIAAKGEAETELTGDDGFVAVMDTFTADSGWLDAAGTCGTDWKMSSSWTFMDVSDSTGAWSPVLDDRVRLWDYGVVGDLSHQNSTMFSAAEYDTIIYDLTCIVQHAIKYDSPNYGFWLIPIDASNYIETRMGTHATSVGHNPTLYVTYVTGTTYRGDWNGREIPFVIMSDDGKDAIVGWSDETDDESIYMTHFIDYHATPPTNPPNATWANIQTLISAGHDVQWHCDADGAPAANGVGGIMSNGVEDSLTNYLSRGPLITALGMSDSTSFLIDMAWPSGSHGAEAIDVARDIGIRSGRATSSRANAAKGIVIQKPPWFADGTVAAQQSDSCRVLTPGDTLNVYALYSRGYVGYLTGNDVNTPCDSIQTNLQRLVDESWRYDKAAIWIYAHDRDTGDGYSGGIISISQMECVAQWLAARPWIWTPTFHELMDFYFSNATACDAPSWANGNHSGIVAADEVYWIWEP